MSQMTVTGKVGPGLTATAMVIPMKSFNINCDTELLSVVGTDDKRTDVDITAATTITITVSGNNYTATIS